MKDIRVKITRDGSGSVRSMPLEEYLRGVVPSEIPASSGAAALQAQAIAARTYAYHKMLTRANQPWDVDDTTANQAYKASNSDSRTDAAIRATAHTILAHAGKVLDTCVYTAANGGRTVSAKERWGNARAYLTAKDDPYDRRAGYAKSGHGVGMSQRGAQQMAKEGLACAAILAYYYPGATLQKIEGSTSAPLPPAMAVKISLKKGCVGEDVRDLQKLLNKLGYGPLKEDGRFGDITENAVGLFLAANRTAVDEIIGTKKL